MSLTQRIHAQRQLIVDDWRVITTYRASLWKTISTGPGYQVAVADPATLTSEPYAIHWRYLHMKWTQRELAQSLHTLHVQQARASPAAPAGFPPHHALWVCIGGSEGSPTSVNPNGHYGMLQMTYNWMNEIRGRASDYPQSVQEWAAENAWKANNYSRSFLVGQWLAYDGAYNCLAYA